MVESWLIKAFARHFLRALEKGERSIEKYFRECLDKKWRKGLLVAWNDQQVSVASGLDGIGAEGEGQRPCSPTGHRSAPLGNAAPALSSLLSWLLSSIYRCLLHLISCTTSSFRPCVRLIQLNASYSKRRSSSHECCRAQQLLDTHLTFLVTWFCVFIYCTLLSKITRFRFPLL